MTDVKPLVEERHGAIDVLTTMLPVLTQLFILHMVLLAISPAVLMVITAAVGAQARGWL